MGEVKVPDLADLEKELNRVNKKKGIRKEIKATLGLFIFMIALFVVVKTYLFPIFTVSGSSMSPTLEDEDIVVFLKTDDYTRGDIVSFYCGGKLLIKRVIGVEGDVISIDGEGRLSISGVAMDEPYVKNLDLGKCDISMPLKVPEGSYFVMGDNREVSLDSRYSRVGCVSKELILGRMLFKI